MKKAVSIFLISALGLSLAACSGASSTAQAEAGETYTGTVSSISEDSMTIAAEDGTEVVITLSSDTEFIYEMGSGGDMPEGEEGEAPDGEAPSDGEAPEGEVPDGEAPSGEAPSGDGSSDGSRDSDSDSSDSDGGSGSDSSDDDEDSGDSDSSDEDEDSEDSDEDESSSTESDVDDEESSSDSSDGDSSDDEDSSDDSEDESSGSDDESSGSDSSGSSEPPELPDGDAPSDGDAPGGEAPDGEEGEAPGGEAPDGEMPSGGEGGMKDLTWEDVSEGDSVTAVINDEGTAESVSIAMEEPDGDSEDAGDSAGAGGDSSGVDSYDAATEYTEDTEVSGETFGSTGTDENAVLLQTEGVSVTLDDVTIMRDSDDSTGGDNSSFYGVGASALVTDGTLTISDGTITSDAAGGAGVFAYGDGAAYVSNTTITTEQDTSGGIHVAGGGTLYAWDLTVETQGESSAAIRSDRGSGTMVVDGGSYTSNGASSPAVYSTADITVHDAVLTAASSEAVCIEGLNTIRLFDCSLSGNMSDSDQNDCTWNVILYQSMSGDSEEGNSTFEMIGGTLAAENGGMFYTTNTESTFILSDVDITYAEDSEYLLKCTGNSNERGWGTSGENGADCTFTAIGQELEGDIIWDTISKLDFYLTDGSALAGAVLDDESEAGDGGDGYANLYIEEGCTWTVTGDSTLSALYNEGTVEDEDGNTVAIIGSDGTTYVEGDSEYTVTVGSYSDSADVSGASELEDWSSYEVSR